MFDTQCYELACSFLGDEEALNNEQHKNALAQAIQDTIEDYIQYERPKDEITDARTDADIKTHAE
jgi:hypothetical protein